MVRRRIISVILAVLIVVCMIVEAIYIKRIEYRNEELSEEVTSLQNELSKQKEDSTNLTEIINEKPDVKDIEVCVPGNIYICAGTVLDIYNESVCFGVNLADYDFFWECEIGDSMSDRFRVRVDDSLIGNYTLTLHIYDLEHNLVSEMSSSLHVVGNVFTGDNPQTVSMLSIGDDYSDDTRWLSYTKELSQGNLTHVGTKGNSEVMKHEAISGISVSEYVYGESVGYTGDNPFINPEIDCFDWNYYTNVSGIDPDVVQIFLSANGLSMEPEEYCNVLSEMIENITETDPNKKIMLVEPIYMGRQEGLQMSETEASGRIFHLMESMEKRFSQMKNVFLVPAGVSINRDSGYDQIMILDNPHGTTTKTISAESFLPSNAGYEQIGDSIFGTLCYLLNEGKIENE